MKKELSVTAAESLLQTLKERFAENMHRHVDVKWSDVQAKLATDTGKLWTLQEMDNTGGEPDVVAYDHVTGEYVFCDCCKESPKNRRSICYDRQALEARKKHQPKNTAADMAKAMGIELLTEEEYRALQKLEAFDLKTSSWVYTPADIRERGGALFCDCRYGHVFLYHNGASSYYSNRGFRGSLRV